MIVSTVKNGIGNILTFSISENNENLLSNCRVKKMCKWLKIIFNGISVKPNEQSETRFGYVMAKKRIKLKV